MEAEEGAMNTGKNYWEVKELKDMEDSQVIANGPCLTSLEDKEEDFDGRGEKADERLGIKTIFKL